MATEALGEERPALFLRKATGLVRGWSVRDSMIYAILATNFVTLAIYVRLRRPGLSHGTADYICADLGDLGVLPGDRIRRPGRHDPAGRR